MGEILNVIISKKKCQLCDRIEVLANAVIVIILQYKNVSNHMLYTLNFYSVTSQLYLNKAGKRKKEHR